jgi:hypothetical protein
MFCECCGFYREVLVVDEGEDLLEIACTLCGFAWLAESEEPSPPHSGG